MMAEKIKPKAPAESETLRDQLASLTDLEYVVCSTNPMSIGPNMLLRASRELGELQAKAEHRQQWLDAAMIWVEILADEGEPIDVRAIRVRGAIKAFIRSMENNEPRGAQPPT